MFKPDLTLKIEKKKQLVQSNISKTRRHLSLKVKTLMRRELMKRFENSHELIGYTLNVGYINATSIPVSLASR